MDEKLKNAVKDWVYANRDGRAIIVVAIESRPNDNLKEMSTVLIGSRENLVEGMAKSINETELNQILGEALMRNLIRKTLGE